VVRVDREFGIATGALAAGDHICGFCVGEAERDAILRRYVEAALRDGDRCLGVVDDGPPAALDPVTLLARLDPELDAPGCVASRQLMLWGTAETYLRGGRFSPDWMAEFWEEQARAAAAEGYEVARVFAEMSWVGRADVDRALLVEYEAWAHRFAARHGYVLLSLYDLRLVGGDVLVDLLKTRPKVLLGGSVLANPYPLTSGELAAAHP